MTTSLATSTGVSNPLVLLQTMIDKGAQPEQLGKLIDLAERWQRNQAAVAFADAITGFQADVPMVEKVRQAGGGDKFGYAFASFDDVMRVARPYLSKYRIVPTFTTEQIEGGIKCTCRIRVGSHVEETTLTVPIADVKTASGTQRMGASLSYAKRYALCAALNIVCTDEDDDGAAEISLIDAGQVAELQELIEAKKVSREKFLEWCSAAQKTSVEKLGELTIQTYAKAIDFLRRKKP